MKKIIILIIAISAAATIFAQASVAVSLKVKGDVELTRLEEIGKLAVGEELFNKDLIESGEESFAAIKFVDGSTIVKLFPYSVLTINSETSNGKMNKKTKLDLGELWTKVDPGSGEFEVETPTTVVSVKGTQFLLRVGEDGSTILYTISGQVEMKNKGDDQTVLVNDGEKAFSTGTGIIEVTPYEEEEIDIIDEGEAETETQTLEIQLENEDGDRKTISIELE